MSEQATLSPASAGRATEPEGSAPRRTTQAPSVSPLPGGTEAPATSFPLDSFRDAAVHLRRPFTAEAVKWKVQAGTLVVPYIDARLVTERLNHVVPHLWHDEYEALAGGKGLLCRLTIDGITRIDVGEGYQGKGLFSDAFKRAAVKFGVGVSLYALPKVFLSTKDGHLKEGKSRKGETVFTITEKGAQGLDKGYRRWLEDHGEPMFGKVLDHGDVADAMGDFEAAAPVESAPEAEEEKPLDDATAIALKERAERLWASIPGDQRKDLKLTPAAFKRQVASATSHGDLEKLVKRLEEAGA